MLSPKRFFLLLVSPLLLCFSLVSAEPRSELETVAQFARDSVLAVKSVSKRGKQYGSAFVIDSKERLILTNYHVVSGANTIVLRRYGDDTEIAAKVVHQDSKLDLALLQALKGGSLPAAVSMKERVGRLGETVLAAGGPGGYDFSITVGIISATERHLSDVNSEIAYLQVDAPMFKGSSGGPLFSMQRELLGLNSRGGADGAVAFAVPTAVLSKFHKEYLEQKDTFVQGYVGIQIQQLTTPLRKALQYDGKEGVLINHVYPSSAASLGGLRRGDILLSIGELTTSADSKDKLALLIQHLKGIQAKKTTAKYFRLGKERHTAIMPLEKSPCELEAIEHAKDVQDFVPIIDGCIVLPNSDYVRVGPLKSKLLRRHLKPGDFIVELDLKSKDLLARYTKWLESGRDGLLTILRAGEPQLIATSAGE